VYDTKLLWRANLHIDERKFRETNNWDTDRANIDNIKANWTWEQLTPDDQEALGNLDWNNRNPWTSPEGNIWDTLGNGHQIDIKPWTRFHCFANTITGEFYLQDGPGLQSWGGGTVYNATAYSWACVDSVFHFNEDMRNQAQALGRNPDAEGSTLATQLPAQNNNNIWLNYISIGANGYVPGYSFYRNKLYNMTASDQHHSAGSDCDSFIYMSASYGDTFYQIHVPDERETTASALPLHSRRTGSITSGYPIPSMDYLVPGDIVEFPGHWAMVLYVNRNPNPLNPEEGIENRITLIEATDWGNMRIMNEHTIQSYIAILSPPLRYYRLGVR
jgi:hypothetical protein